MKTDFDLERFVTAQQVDYKQALEELKAGKKQTHWMWYVFPQLQGLGKSPLARKFAISGKDEAAAYLAHPILGPRLRECTEAVNRIEGRTANEIFNAPDDLKFHSSMTLFSEVTTDNAIFLEAIRKYYRGEPDEMTRTKLEFVF